MKQTKIIMGMPVTLEIQDEKAAQKDLEKVFSYFRDIDEKFSTYKETSEITKINRGEIKKSDWSSEMREVFELAEETKKLTNGFFDIKTPAGPYDPSGLVKGWSIHNASGILLQNGFKNFYVDAGGDIEAYGKYWQVGIRNPRNRHENVKIVYIKDIGIATSGTYIRGNHIYNPKQKDEVLEEILSLTVIGPDVFEADRFATAAFAMGKEGINFIENLPGFEGYMINKNGIATMTSGFEKYTAKPIT